jgi:threonine/homoserine/homoserine lactone efflux protein
VLLGLVFVVLAAASDSTGAIAAGTARTWSARRPTRLDTLSATGGTMMIGLGATMLAVE